jgi:hypothetical protein
MLDGAHDGRVKTKDGGERWSSRTRQPRAVCGYGWKSGLMNMVHHDEVIIDRLVMGDATITFRCRRMPRISPILLRTICCQCLGRDEGDVDSQMMKTRWWLVCLAQPEKKRASEGDNRGKCVQENVCCRHGGARLG